MAKNIFHLYSIFPAYIDVVGFSRNFMQCCTLRYLEKAKSLKSQYPEAIAIICGKHPSRSLFLNIFHGIICEHVETYVIT